VYIFKKSVIIAVLIGFAINFAAGEVCGLPDKATLHAQAVVDSMVPVRPGIGGMRPFWNIRAERFINVPAFDFQKINGAVKYRFTATSEVSQKDYVFEADVPWAPLSEIWAKLPVGYVTVVVEGIDKNGKVLGACAIKRMTGRTRVKTRQQHGRRFYRAAVFNGPYHKPVREYRESAKMALEYLFNQSHTQRWLTESDPDPEFQFYCYPSKIIGAVVESMVMYSELAGQKDAEKAMVIAKNAADYMIRASEPAGAPLEFMPPTYYGEERQAGENKGKFMISESCRVAFVFLDLYDKTKEKRYYDAAERIGDTVAKTQLASGSWYYQHVYKTGEAALETPIIPVFMIKLFERFESQYGVKKYERNRERALNWIMENPMKDFHWIGTFEDTKPGEKYSNLTHWIVDILTEYLFERSDENPKNLEYAKELLRFAEDQFVVWERPLTYKPNWNWEIEANSDSDDWITPCVLEQYVYYVPIGASSACMNMVFQKAYEVTGDELYLAKAISLGNTTTVAQDRYMGRYPTLWETNSRGEPIQDWYNCATYEAKALLELADLLEKENSAVNSCKKNM